MAAIERAAQVHAAVMAAIHRAAFPPGEAWGEDAMSLQLAMPGCFGLLAASGAMLLGRTITDQAEILTLAVIPQARRHGLATSLLNAAMVEARALGAETMFLEVATANAAAQALYARAGFTEVGQRRRYYADGSDALVMRVNLF
jgi:[ribosomal protein S18]-alanine N-acetyltransferase